jgi:hypothetical protein
VIRVVGLLLVAGLVLSACGTQSEAKAMSGWVKQSEFHANTMTLMADVHHSATALEDPSSSAHELHLVCGVLVTDTEEANASLPTPDTQSTSLLSRAYTDIGAGANTCFGAGANAVVRTNALGYLQKGLGELSEAVLRVDVAAGRSPH